MDQAAIDYVLTIVQLLAKGADDRRLSPMKVNILNQNVEALTRTTTATSSSVSFWRC